MPEDLHHDSTGDDSAPVLLLGCSLGTAIAMWEPQVAPLAEHLRVIRYDHRGHGAYTRAWLRSMLLATDADGYAACCGAIERMDLRAALPSIAAPTLVVSGADDQAAPPEHQRALAEAIPAARLETLAPAAHIASVERADEVTELIFGHILRSLR